MSVLDRLNKHLGTKVMNEDVAPEKRSNKDVVGDVFEKFLESNPSFQTQIHEIVWNILKAHQAESQSNDDLLVKKAALVKSIYGDLKATLASAIGSVEDAFTGK